MIECWLMKHGTRYTIHDLINSNIKYDYQLWDILLSFQGKSMNTELSKRNGVSGLYPFMTAAVSKKQRLGFVYYLAIRDPMSIVEGKKRVLEVEVSEEAVIGNNKRGRTCGN